MEQFTEPVGGNSTALLYSVGRGDTTLCKTGEWENMNRRTLHFPFQVRQTKSTGLARLA